ncbi:cyclase family protein [Mameliella alba]|nr:cyclase family protein [Mameliella sediminis]MBY6116158.1 cyclase family protein [Antarctobacter heliothermus]MBY6146123.1 cyclase family protein [Mameliella alba]
MSKEQGGQRRFQNRPPGSNWGDFGDDDCLGRLNLITPERRRKAAEEIREGLTFCLSLPLDIPGRNVLNPNRKSPKLKPTVRRHGEAYHYRVEQEHAGVVDVSCDDVITIYSQYSTQWDSLAHNGALFDADGDGVAEEVYYNGYRARVDVIAPDAESGRGGSNPLGIDRLAESCVQGRGVLVDLEKVFGPERRLIGLPELNHAMDVLGLEIEVGDVLCLHTGFARELWKMGDTPDAKTLACVGAELDGADRSLLDWISGSGIAALVADNAVVEHRPAAPRTDGVLLPLHNHCLFKLGLPLGELWHLSDLARWLNRAGRTRFFLSAPPLRLPGAVGSPVTPVATV